MYLIGIVTVFENHANHSTLMQVPGVGKQNGLMLVLNPTPPPHHKEPGDMDTHRRRINTEEKAKVVAAVWGTDFFYISYGPWQYMLETPVHVRSLKLSNNQRRGKKILAALTLFH